MSRRRQRCSNRWRSRSQLRVTMANARRGQKNKITRPLLSFACKRLPGNGWAQRGTRRCAPHDQRTILTYIFGAICPALSKGAGFALPFYNTDAMNPHLVEIARTVTLGAHAVVIMGQAGWHMTAALIIPGNISILPLPAKCPELNPVENIWQFMRDNWLSNRIFEPYNEIVDHCCDSWNKMIGQSACIKSIGIRKWAHEC